MFIIIVVDPLRLCHESMTLGGKCSSSSGFSPSSCFGAFNSKYGASAVTQNCSCKDNNNNTHVCTCCINCVYSSTKNYCS